MTTIVHHEAPEPITEVLHDGITPETETPRAMPNIAACSLEDALKLREEIDVDLRYLRDRKTEIDADLERRILAAHPEYDAEKGGTVSLAGDSLILKMGYTKTYEYDAGRLANVLADNLVTKGEWDELIPEWAPKVNGRFYTKLLGMGNERLTEALKRARVVKSRPDFKIEARK